MFSIPNTLLIDIFSGEGLRITRSDLPKDAKFIDAHYDMQRRAFLAVYEHESFPETPEGMVIPFADIECWVEYFEEEEDSE
jgi:hypothetical protein